MRESLRLVVLTALSALMLTACGGAPEDGIDLGAPGPGRRPLEVDPGAKISITQNQGQASLGFVLPIQGTNPTVYYKLDSALPSGTSSLTLTVVADTNVPNPYTFSTAEVAYSSTSSPSSSSTLFVDSTNHIGLIWGFTWNGSSWTGRATWYHNSSSNIALSAGTYTLTNNTTDTALTYVAEDVAP